MLETEACFFLGVAFLGDQTCYPIGADIALEAEEGNLNDKFKSVKVGVAAKVLAWQHTNETGEYEEWVGDHPDISSIGGLSRFKVVYASTLAIALRFEDNTDAPDGTHCMTAESYDVGKAKSCSGDPEFKLVGIIPENGPPVTTAIYVRNEVTGVYVATGSIFFHWNGDENQIDIVEDANFPSNCSHERHSANEFIIRLESLPAA